MAQREDASKMASLVSHILKHAKPVRPEPSLYLEPDDSPFSPPGRSEIISYQLTVARTLVKPMELRYRGERYKETASLVCLPSFTPEWA
jgi:hypothetical protein